MLRTAIAFFLLGIFAFMLGAGGIAGLSVDIGRLLLEVFLVLSVITFVLAMFSKGPPSLPL